MTAINLEAAILLAGELPALADTARELDETVDLWLDDDERDPETRERLRTALAETYERVLPLLAGAVRRTARVLEHLAGDVEPPDASIAEVVAALSALDDAGKVSRALRIAADGLSAIREHVPSNDGVRDLAASTIVRVRDALEPGEAA